MMAMATAATERSMSSRVFFSPSLNRRPYYGGGGTTAVTLFHSPKKKKVVADESTLMCHEDLPPKGDASIRQQKTSFSSYPLQKVDPNGRNQNQQHQQHQSNQKHAFAKMKSPTTMNFERMLDAANYIAAHPNKEDDYYERRGEAKRKLSHDLESLSSYSPPSRSSSASSKRKRMSLLECSDNEDDYYYKGYPRDYSDDKDDESSGLTSCCDLEEGNPFLEIEVDPNLYKAVVLKMALQRQVYDNNSNKKPNNPKVNKQTPPPPPPSSSSSSTPLKVICDGFFWRDYPACEQVLYDNMAEYYQISSIQRQSKKQQAYNTELVKQIRAVAKDSGLTFDASFTEKKLRDRIRCFYKTHLQNAKKRLQTLQKHPHSPDHQASLRVYIRCVKTGMSVEESQRLEPSFKTKYQRKHTVSIDDSKITQALSTATFRSSQQTTRGSSASLSTRPGK